LNSQSWISVSSSLNAGSEHDAPIDHFSVLKELSERGGEFDVGAYTLGLFKQQVRRTFVELGANDGNNSHTRVLEQRLHWRGSCIEASPPMFNQLQARRPLCLNVNAVVWRKRRNVTFRSFPHHSALHGHSGIVSLRSRQAWSALLHAHPTGYTDQQVPGIPIRDLVLAGIVPRVVDWWVLDVEGAEMLLLQQFPWDTVTVRVWTIESNKIVGGRQVLHAMMRSRGYSCADFDAINTCCTSCTDRLTRHSRSVCD